MANTRFETPLFMKKKHYVQELASLEDVFDFLDELPADKRDATTEVLEKACRKAAQGIFPLPAIRENVRRFLIKRHILANIEEAPIIAKRLDDRNIDS